MSKPLILASKSPRRKELLEKLQVPFSILTCEVDEFIPAEFTPQAAVLFLAQKKANVISQQFPQSIVIGADTIVVSEQNILGKPKNADDAYHMLKALSGKTHDVLTGVSIQSKQKEVHFFEKTMVTFWELSDEEIHRYIRSGEPFDKAGSYGIQGLGAVFVKSIQGDYYTVVGLPISKVYHELKEFNVIS
ncbi:Maf family protein [Bacillus sp. 2205SS5-2]|uniref:Maf family protein n=1 Tax=Bacillus sp. 2205SS5-2 TaxID=3109031 RepID=UPI003006286C